MKWTDEQLAAITSRGDLIVSAAAGAGKTAVLTERICAEAAAGTELSRFLVMTFTRAAAAEMKNRITRRLFALSDEADDPETRSRLRAEAHAVTGANISTIHAFCARVLRRHGHLLGLSPKARVGDEMELSALREQARDALLTALGERRDESWHTLLSAFSANGSEDGAFDAVERAYEFMLTQPDPGAWLSSCIDAYERADALLDEVVRVNRQELSAAIDVLTAAADAMPEAFLGARAAIEDDIARCRAFLLLPSFDAYREALFTLSYQRMVFPKGTPDAEKAPYQDARDLGKSVIKKQRERMRRSADEERAVMAGAAKVLRALLEVVRGYDETFSRMKREKCLLDYNDLEHLCLAALELPAVQREYRERFDFVAVDEYQDSNRTQEAILQRVAHSGSRFLVGDVKQSIYRFRRAEPALFLEKLRDAASGGLSRVDLTKNFRSAQGVIDCVNGVFSALMSGQAGEIDYDARARLVCGRPELKGGAELHVIEHDGEDGEEDAHDAIVEARFVAARIRALMAENPAYHYSDMAVLLRATTHAEKFAGALSAEGVPCYAQSNGGYFDAVEVQVLLNLLRVLDNGRRDIPLLSVLRSAIGGFTEAELAEIRTRCPDGPFYEAAAAAAADGDALGMRLAAFYAQLARWRAESLLLPVDELIGLMLDETGFYEEMGVLPGGAQRQANLDALTEKAHAFQNSGARGLYAFLRHIELASGHASFGAAQTASADVVRLLSIHKSKGLEFPVVFVCQLGVRFSSADSKPALILHSEGGIGLRYIDGRVVRDTAARSALLSRIRTESRSEELRVLYVALTRAKERLILSGCIKNAAEKTAPPARPPLPGEVLAASTPLRWLLSCRGDFLPLTLHARGEWLGETDPAHEPAPLPAENADVTAAIRARFAWAYPFAASIDLPAKAAVSRLEGEDTPTFDPPAFITGGAPTALSLGSAAHAALQRLPGGPLTKEDARAFLDALAQKGLLGTAEAAALDARDLAWFTQMPLCRALETSAWSERELPFACPTDAGALYDTGAEETVLLQGVIDACFLGDDGNWTLIDYKTDAPREGDDEETLRARHARQVGLYAGALETLTHTPVTRIELVYLRLHRIVRVRG